ncbi:hypothetical protein ERJ75_000212300 [Trypanosoma vivax]|uniref:Uncharacterized protein n=1 Tax=Trypanosoma vivax (strain Y486) TaxID=1055687 RepID=G0U9X1_TRYVY|nr:hypothetical protein TRVL_02364 [Trypanosoma vivax]KAH8619075.1 hypothetical protein ERJ75_000212300 [Trypanosoma vivax]CCC52602.1 conserved hypothetical protein [Trypanosoma vivax Y486]
MESVSEPLNGQREMGEESIDKLRVKFVQRVRADLDAIVASCRASLREEDAEMARRCKKILHMAGELTASIEGWFERATASVGQIEADQKQLWSRVQETANSIAARREELLKRQEDRAEQVRALCMERFKEVELSS